MKSFRFFTFALFFALSGTAYAMILDVPVMPHFFRAEAPNLSPAIKFEKFVMPVKAKKASAGLENRLNSLQQEFLISRALEKSS